MPNESHVTIVFSTAPGTRPRLVGALLCEVNDELVAAPRCYMADATLTPLTDADEERLPSTPAVTA
ncbi:MAG: hypothetical protein WD377_00500 [Nitriliruptoraceae bacterium]